MTELGPMPPTADVGPIAPDAGRLEPIAAGVWAWLGTDGAGGPGPNVGVVVEDDGITLIDTLAAPSAARALNEELKSADWFDAAKYPAMTFHSTKIVRTGEDTADRGAEQRCGQHRAERG